MQQVLADLCAFGYVFGIAIAVGRGDPIARAFYPIENFKAFICQMIFITWTVMLLCLEWVDCPDVLGQRPWAWAYLLWVIYAWVCLGNYILKRS